MLRVVQGLQQARPNCFSRRSQPLPVPCYRKTVRFQARRSASMVAANDDVVDVVPHAAKAWEFFRSIGAPKYHVAPMVDQVVHQSTQRSQTTIMKSELLCGSTSFAEMTCCGGLCLQTALCSLSCPSDYSVESMGPQPPTLPCCIAGSFSRDLPTEKSTSLPVLRTGTAKLHSLFWCEGSIRMQVCE